MPLFNWFRIIYLQGTYKMHIMYGTVPVTGSPFTIQSYDPSRVTVREITDGIVGKPSSYVGKLQMCQDAKI